VALTVALSCAATPQRIKTHNARVIFDVPFYPQEEFQCGPAAMASVLRFWNVTVEPDEVAGAIFSKSARGTLTLDMVEYARGKGLVTEQVRGDRGVLVRTIDAGRPLIVLVDLGFSFFQRNHYMVVTGYADDGVVAHSGKHPHRLITWKEFLPAWEKTGYWTLLIAEP